ncbi:CDC27 family protein [Nitratifractor sp.]
MYDIAELEKKWQKYSRKRLIKRLLIGLAILIFLSVPFLYTTYRSDSEPKHEKALSAHGEKNQSKLHKQVVESNRDDSEMLKPEVPSLSKEAASSEGSRRKTGMKMIISDQGGPAVTEGETVEEKKIRLEMVAAKNGQVIKEIEARFPTTRDYEDAMYLAKYYYGKKNYRKAEYWALQANTIDSSKEESWLIFGKSKAKQGRRADALRVLQAYYDRSGSTHVKELIDRIRKGKPY